MAPSPVVELNRAVAVAMADGPEVGLAIVDAIAERRPARRLPVPPFDAGRPAAPSRPPARGRDRLRAGPGADRERAGAGLPPGASPRDVGRPGLSRPLLTARRLQRDLRVLGPWAAVRRGAPAPTVAGSWSLTASACRAEETRRAFCEEDADASPIVGSWRLDLDDRGRVYGWRDHSAVHWWDRPVRRAASTGGGGSLDRAPPSIRRRSPARRSCPAGSRPTPRTRRSRTRSRRSRPPTRTSRSTTRSSPATTRRSWPRTSRRRTFRTSSTSTPASATPWIGPGLPPAARRLHREVGLRHEHVLPGLPRPVQGHRRQDLRPAQGRQHHRRWPTTRPRSRPPRRPSMSS